MQAEWEEKERLIAFIETLKEEISDLEKNS